MEESHGSPTDLEEGLLLEGGGWIFYTALQDKWIPNYTMNRILHMPSKVDRELWVCDLTNWACHDWDRERIGSMFHREEAKAIYYIPLSKRHLSDSILWMPKN